MHQISDLQLGWWGLAILLIVVTALVIEHLWLRKPPPARPPSHALQMLERKFAAGEISIEEYAQQKTGLETSESSQAPGTENSKPSS